jgi:serine/threonine-protein kinase
LLAATHPNQLLRQRYIIRQIIGAAVWVRFTWPRTAAWTGACEGSRDRQDLRSYLRGLEQFYPEASLLARLDHPNLPKVSDFFSEADGYW